MTKYYRLIVSVGLSSPIAFLLCNLGRVFSTTKNAKGHEVLIYYFLSSFVFLGVLRGELLLGQTRSYLRPKSEKNKNFLQFFNSLPNNELSLLYPLSAARYTLFFRPNAQVRPFIERRSFSVPSEYCLRFRSFVLDI